MGKTINPDVRDGIPTFEQVVADWKCNPNLISNWYPKVVDCGIRTPMTEIISIPTEVIRSLFNERKGDAQRVGAFVHEKVMPAVERMQGATHRPPFLKNGCYSGKFNFKLCAPEKADEQTMLRSFKAINEEALCFGAMGATEFAVRERIKAPESLPAIYSGMPLQTEFRVFYDFNSRKALYIVNYWNKDDVYEAICRNEKDKESFDARNPYIESDYRINCGHIFDLVDGAMKNVKGLSGMWSVDILLDAWRQAWLIDMALAPQSYYWDFPKATMCAFEDEFWKVMNNLDPRTATAVAMAAPLGEYRVSTKPVDDIWEIRYEGFQKVTGLSGQELINKLMDYLGLKPEDSNGKENDIQVQITAVLRYVTEYIEQQNNKQ